MLGSSGMVKPPLAHEATAVSRALPPDARGDGVDITLESRHHPVMRTTLAIDDDVLEEVKRLARARSASVGKTASELLRRALEAECPTKQVDGLLILDPGPRSTEVAASTVRRLVEDER